MEASWGFLEASWTLLGQPGGILGALGAALEASWPLLGRSWRPLGRSGVCLGRSWDGLKRILRAKRLPKRSPGGSKTGSRKRLELKRAKSQNFEDVLRNSLIFKVSGLHFGDQNGSKTSSELQHRCCRPLGTHLECSWRVLGASWKHLERSWPLKRPPGLKTNVNQRDRT